MSDWGKCGHHWKRGFAILCKYPHMCVIAISLFLSPSIVFYILLMLRIDGIETKDKKGIKGKRGKRERKHRFAHIKWFEICRSKYILWRVVLMWYTRLYRLHFITMSCVLVFLFSFFFFFCTILFFDSILFYIYFILFDFIFSWACRKAIHTFWL